MGSHACAGYHAPRFHDHGPAHPAPSQPVDGHRCADRDRCPSLSESCEAPSRDGNVNHFIVSSEPLSGENVWQPFATGEIIGVDRKMDLHRAHVDRRALPILLTQ